MGSRRRAPGKCRAPGRCRQGRGTAEHPQRDLIVLAAGGAANFWGSAKGSWEYQVSELSGRPLGPLCPSVRGPGSLDTPYTCKN